MTAFHQNLATERVEERAVQSIAGAQPLPSLSRPARPTQAPFWIAGSTRPAAPSIANSLTATCAGGTMRTKRPSPRQGDAHFGPHVSIVPSLGRTEGRAKESGLDHLVEARRSSGRAPRAEPDRPAWVGYVGDEALPVPLTSSRGSVERPSMSRAIIGSPRRRHGLSGRERPTPPAARGTVVTDTDSKPHTSAKPVTCAFANLVGVQLGVGGPNSPISGRHWRRAGVRAEVPRY